MPSCLRLAAGLFVALLMLVPAASGQAEAQSSLLGDSSFQSALDTPPATGSAGTSITDPIAGLIATTAPYNASSIFQQGSRNFASQVIVGVGNQVAQVQNGNGNVSTITGLGVIASQIGVFQDGDNLTSHILLLGTTEANVVHLQKGSDQALPIMVIGDLGVVVGSRFVRNESGRPIRNVIVRNK